jgi:hypothetical protein
VKSIQELDVQVSSSGDILSSLALRVDALEQQGTASTSATLSTDVNSEISNLKFQISNLTSQVTSLSASLMPISPIPSLATSGAQLTFDALDVKDATISGTLSVLGRTLLSDVGITGTINTGVLTINGLDNNGFAAINTLSGPLKLQSDGLNGLDILDGKVTITTNGDIKTTGEITAKSINTEKLNITTDTTSSASAILSTSASISKVKAGQNTLTIHTTAVTGKSLIYVTFMDDYGPALRYWVADKIAGTSFTLHLDSPVAADAQFNWWIVN